MYSCSLSTSSRCSRSIVFTCDADHDGIEHGTHCWTRHMMAMRAWASSTQQRRHDFKGVRRRCLAENADPAYGAPCHEC